MMRNLSTAVLFLLYTLIIAGIIVLFWHWLMPKSIHFLTTPQIDLIKVATLSALVANFLNNFRDK
jgi:hypothetical protein